MEMAATNAAFQVGFQFSVSALRQYARAARLCSSWLPPKSKAREWAMAMAVLAFMVAPSFVVNIMYRFFDTSHCAVTSRDISRCLAGQPNRLESSERYATSCDTSRRAFSR